jgi:hypothetical protein
MTEAPAVIEDLVVRQTVERLFTGVGKRLENLVNPCCRANRRIGEGIADILRSRYLFEVVTTFI